jgi:hypothetical protein
MSDNALLDRHRLWFSNLTGCWFSNRGTALWRDLWA